MNTAIKVENSTQTDTPVLDINQDPEQAKRRQKDQMFLSLFPTSFQNEIKDCAEADALSIAAYFNPILAFFAQAAGTWFKIKTQDYINSPNLYLMTVGEPSTGKSRGEARFFEAIAQRDKQLQLATNNEQHAYLQSTSHAKMEEVLINSGSVLHRVGEADRYFGKLADMKEEGSSWLTMQLDLFVDTHLKRAFRGDGISQTDTAIFSQLSNTQPSNFLKLYKHEGSGLPFRFLVYPITEESKPIPYETVSGSTRAIQRALEQVFAFGKPHIFDLKQSKSAHNLVIDCLNELKELARNTDSPLEKALIGKDEINFIKLILIDHIISRSSVGDDLAADIGEATIQKAFKRINLYREAHIWTHNYCSTLTKKKSRSITQQEIAAELLAIINKKGIEVNKTKLAEYTGISRDQFTPSHNPHLR